MSGLVLQRLQKLHGGHSMGQCHDLFMGIFVKLRACDLGHPALSLAELNFCLTWQESKYKKIQTPPK